MKSYLISGKLAQEQKRYRKKQIGVETPPPPSAYRVKSV